jgi:hypothetical protein
MRKLFTLLLSVLMIAIVSSVIAKDTIVQNKVSQEEVDKLKLKPLNGFFGITFTNSVPQDEFHDNTNKTGLGFSLLGGYYADPVPVAFGVEADFLFFGGKTKYMNVHKYGFYIGQDTIDTQSMIIPIVLFARLQPNTGFIVPYLEGFAGINIFSTTATLNTYQYEESSQDKISASWAYGLGAGLSIKLFDFITLPDQRTSLNLDLKMKYSFGTTAEYSKVQILETGYTEFETYKSKTDMIMTNVGISLCF